MLHSINHLNDLADVLHTKGNILLDGIKILDNKINAYNLHHKVGMVFTRPVVVPSSIRHNLTYGCAEAMLTDSVLIEENNERSFLPEPL